MPEKLTAADYLRVIDFLREHYEPFVDALARHHAEDAAEDEADRIIGALVDQGIRLHPAHAPELTPAA